MRVLYLAPQARKPSQLSRHSFLDEEIRALADAGIDAYVIAPPAFSNDDNGRLHVRSLPPDSRAERWRALRFFAAHPLAVPFANLFDTYTSYRAVRIQRFAAELIVRERIQLIHSYFGWPAGYGGLLAKAATGTPLVAGLRGGDVNMIPTLNYGSRRYPSYDRAFRRLLRRADQLLYVSGFLERQALALGARAERGRVVLKGVRLETFSSARRAQARADLGWGDRVTILAVAGLVAIKGVHHILEALATLRASHSFSLVVCGEGEERQALENLARRLNIADRTTFPGKVARAEIAKFFAAADIFVHGALIEASGNVLLEAMASSLPIVCTDAGGPAEYVLDGVTGLVVPVADPGAMAEKIVKLLGDASLRQEFGRRARHRAETQLSYQRMIDETLATYHRLLNTPATQTSTLKTPGELSCQARSVERAE